MILRKCATMVLLGVFLVTGNAEAAEKKRLPVNVANTKQKIAYFKNMYANSTAAKRVKESGNEDALNEFNNIGQLYEGAKVDFEKGDYLSANDKINKALRLLSKVSLKHASPDVKIKQQLKVYKERRDSVAAILEAYDRIAKEKDVGARAITKSFQVKGHMQKADRLIGSREMEKGLAELNTAYNLVTTLTADLRQGDTLVRVLKLDTPEDHFIYEKDRNDSLVSILQLALNEKKPRPKTLVKIEGLRLEAENSRKKSDAQAEGGDFEDALKNIMLSTRNLIKAVRMAGLFIPG